MIEAARCIRTSQFWTGYVASRGSRKLPSYSRPENLIFSFVSCISLIKEKRKNVR